jgi:hypothetical protein
MPDTCPCCGGALREAVPVSALSAVPLPDSERAILDLAIAAYPLGVSTAAIVNSIWGTRADGGPLDTKNGIGVRVYRLNAKIKPLGWRVCAVGHAFKGRRLEPIIPVVHSQVRTAGKSPANGLATHAARA